MITVIYIADRYGLILDIDECLAMTDDCSEYAECVNTEGSFECVCKPGFTGDGITCDGQ